eukprot:gb/GECG01009411.1/.p1 GENE.gb/GECG01009411.1/~~gb/GECG01009411.1/.p1  ORF type:complete len:311 (+),score=29.47 gb/GECG01009411.1/:1-933(+)
MDHFVAGVLGGMTSTLVLHPVDLIKVRYQVHGSSSASRSGKYKSIWQTIRTIIREETLRGMYKGVTPALMGAGSSWGLYFLFYEQSKARYARRHIRPDDSQQSLEEPKKVLTPGEYMLAAWEGGSFTVLFTNPIWLIKTRLQLQESSTPTYSKSGKQIIPYTSLHKTIRLIYKEEGFRGFYRGCVPALVLTSHGVIQFSLYEQLKQKAPKLMSAEGSAAYFVIGAFSKVIATTATYPLQVIKSRLQQRFTEERAYRGPLDCATKIVRTEGWLALYSGFVPNLLRTVPASAITLLAYEHSKRLVQMVLPST